MKKRIVSLAMAVVLLLTICLPVAASITPYSTESTDGSTGTSVSVKLAATAVLYTGTAMKSAVNLSAISGAPETFTVLNTTTANGILWYILNTDKAFGDQPLYLMHCYVKASDAKPVDANGEVIKVGLTDKDGQSVTSISLSGRNAKQKITASAPAGVSGKAQWQIKIPDTGHWANIFGAGETLTVSYGLVAQLLKLDSVTLRCRWTDAIGVRYFSDELTVSYSEATATDAQSTTDETISTVDGAAETTAADAVAPAYNDEPALLSADVPVGTLPPVQVAVSPMSETGADTNDETNPDVKKTYNIVINYVFENNEIVSEPYTANLAGGSSFSANVTFPTVLGYLPYVNEVQQNSIELNYPSVSEDVTINVVYKPTNVNYTVIHYQQNVNDDNYTIESTETKQGLTESEVPEVAKKFDGFYSLLYERPNIAADGSTVIEVYYDRYYYLMNFDMDGGYGTEPVYARYGADIGTVTEPTKAGYTFKGWSETKGGTTAVTLPTTMPAESKTYYAIWQVTDKAKVTVVFWGENADDEQYSYLSEYTKEIQLIPGSEFTYSETGMLTCGKDTHTHTDDCYEFTCTKQDHEHTADCIKCGITPHTHGVGCYEGAGSSANPLNPPNNPKNGQVYSSPLGIIYSYIYINGNWYNYSGSVSNGNVVTPNCGMEENNHVHSDVCIQCGQEEHIHTRENCYKLTCTKTEHTHTSSCYEQGAGLDSTLWKFVKSDTITVAADGSSVVNVYYDRVEYSVQFYNNQSCSTSGSGGYGGTQNQEYTDLKITAKWGENILDKWPSYNNSSSWLVKDKSNTWQNSIQVMPVGGAKFWGPKTGNSKYFATYYVEVLPGKESEGTKASDNRYYKVHHTDTSVSSGNVTDEERYGIDGFTINNSISTKNGTSYGGSKFYYTRNSYNLTFNDQYNDVKKESVKFEASLNTYKDYVPEVPSAYEPDSVEFGGWYQNPQCTGEEYKLDEHTMPSHDIILYAKWVPVTHTVKFYLTEKSTDVYTPKNAETAASFEVPHGDNIAEEYVKNHLEKSAMNEAKPNGDYTFVMWYYYENGKDGVKKPFDPTTQIRKDLTLYGEWSSNTLKEYTVQYVLAEKDADGNVVVKKNDQGELIKVADDLTGSGLAGTTKTFDAKGGTDLYADYQEDYFPTVQSQSLLLDIESNSLVITFEYVPMPAVPYTVKYVEKDTGNSLADDKVVKDNRKAVVTETFKPISGYMPDAYQKRLVVTADGENILYFYYKKDETHAYYKITHYTQNTDGATWTEYASSQAVGDIGTCYTASPMTIPGFTYQEIKYVVNGTEVTDVTTEGAALTADGLEINLYYVRNEYPYQVQYLEQGTGKKLHDPKNGSGKYGQVISESAINIDGYDKVDPTSAMLNIRINEGEGAPNINIIIFYYKEQEVTINYVAVGPQGATEFSSVDPTTETVKVKSGTAQGSTPTAGEGFKFVGWFKDVDCTQPVDASWVTDNKIVPQKTDDKNVAATYYAKFEYDVFDLMIEKKVTGNGAPYSENDSFIFTVTSEDVKDFKSLEVVLRAGETVTIKGLKVGTYTVTEDTGWSWRYTPGENDQKVDGEKVVKSEETGTVTFTNTLANDKWLGEQASCENYWETDTTIKKDPIWKKSEESSEDESTNP